MPYNPGTSDWTGGCPQALFPVEILTRTLVTHRSDVGQLQKTGPKHPAAQKTHSKYNIHIKLKVLLKPRGLMAHSRS